MASALSPSSLRLWVSGSLRPIPCGNPCEECAGIAKNPVRIERRDAEAQRLVTTAFHTLTLPSGATGREVWLTARWFNLRGEEGPAAAPQRTMACG